MAALFLSPSYDSTSLLLKSKSKQALPLLKSKFKIYFPLKPKIKNCMKKRLLFLLATILFTNTYAQSNLTVKEQLQHLNKYWAVSSCDYAILNTSTALDTEVKLIQTHLQLVEQYLRSQPMNHLSTQQKTERLKCLDVLKDYYSKGQFPKNLYHAQRTPYFIDDFGTACAVGQLVISSGHQDLAQKISTENNYAYIEDMHYPELITWADEHGFQLDELKWIQPTYSCYVECNPGEVRNLSCYGNNAYGCVGLPLNINLSSPPYQYGFYMYIPSSNIWASSSSCDLAAGQYKWVITDMLGDTQEFLYTLTMPDTLVMTITTAMDNGTCNGSLSINIEGGSPPYTYLLNSLPADSISTNLCSGNYIVSVIDTSHCTRTQSVFIDSNVSTETLNSDTNSVSITPNPATTQLLITSTLPSDVATELFVYNAMGQLVYNTNAASTTFELDLTNFAKGIYHINLKNGQQSLTKRFLKQ